jgi:hypothetical protein
MDDLAIKIVDLPDTVRFFDLVTANNDRSLNYGFVTGDLNQLVLFDNAAMFFRLHFPIPITFKDAANLKVSADVLEKARSLDIKEIGQIGLTPDRSKWLLIRCKTLVDAIDKGWDDSSDSNPNKWLEFKMDE